MGNLLYIVAVVLVIIWAIGFFGYAAGGLIHIASHCPGTVSLEDHS
ncbi:MAG: lmo0937 family membrane protein [Ferruginibacter sp.]